MSAAAGVGKSCVIAQVVASLEAKDVPVIAVRMDRHGNARLTRDVGSQMGLPGSPSVVLAGIAHGRDSVLVVDQLDAVSQVSGRYPHLWEVFDSLRQEAMAYPNMRMVIACRDFDLDHDQRLRKLKQPGLAMPVTIPLLSSQDVDTILVAAGVATQLGVRQREILRTPFHLFLFLDGLGDDRGDITFRDRGELFDRYWERKSKAVSARSGQADSWTKVIDKLCEVMSRDLTLSVPSVAIDEWGAAVAAMLTEHVLVRDGNQIRFFHESFFDYAFARRFSAKGGELVVLLRSGEQHLFRRSQVRQILAFLRDHSPAQYLVQLRAVLGDKGVRFHIKRLVLAWLGAASDPMPDEWTVVEALLDQPDMRRHALPSIRNSLRWFDLLNGLGVVARWLAAPDEEMVNRGVWFLMLSEVQKERSEIAASLLAPYCGCDSKWANRLRAYFRFESAYQSHAIQRLFLQALDAGVFAEASQGHGDWWDRLRGAAEHAPLFAIEAMVHWLDYEIAAASTSPPDGLFGQREHDPTAIQLIAQVARQEPAAYLDEVLPRVLTIVNLSAAPSCDGLREDGVWRFRSNHEPMYISHAVLEGVVSALERLAVDTPDKVDSATAKLLHTEWETPTYLLLRAWSANPARFGSTCVGFLAEDPRRLVVGYSSWGDGGTGHAAISREAILMSVPYANNEERRRLELAIMGFKRRNDDGDCYLEWLLLEAFGEAHLSEGGNARLVELRAKFAGDDAALPPRRCSSMARTVGSPIPPEETKLLTDEEWLAAMRRYNYGWDGALRGVDRDLKGSAVELSRQLQPQSRRERQRFAALTDRMEDSIRPEYFEAILDGICGVENLSKEDREGDDANFDSLETEVVLGVVRRLHRLPERSCGRSICRAFERLARRSLPDADLHLLSYYALEHADPASDEWLQRNATNNRDPSEDAHFYGYNSVRGHAARAISALLFADYSRQKILVPLLRQMVRDRSLAVRTCVVEAVLPLLNHSRDDAVDLFVETCTGASLVFGSGPFEEFVRYASSTHYLELRGILYAAIHSSSPKSVAAAARQICLAAFSDVVAEGDAEAVRTGRTSLKMALRSITSVAKNVKRPRLWRLLSSLRLTARSVLGFPALSSEMMRCAAAEVYSHNLSDAAVGSTCEERLCLLFSDKSDKVRTGAARCFWHLGDDANFSKHVGIIRAYIESPAFPSQHDYLLMRLENSTWQLPDVIIRLAQRFVAACGAAAGDLSTAASGDAPTISKLVVRLYAQTNDDVVRTKCLDVIDEMERFAFYGVDLQLAEHER